MIELAHSSRVTSTFDPKRTFKKGRWLVKLPVTSFLAALLVVVAVVCFFRWANYETKKAHAAFTTRDVIAAIENVISPVDVDHDEWDSFLRWPIRDPRLETVRQRCLGISKEYSGLETGKDIATAGEAQLRVILNELRNLA